MIRFESIEIENFSSIEHLYLEFYDGVYTIIGDNGSGKTSILMALLQGLFNKNIKTEKDTIDETYNKVTGKPYKITIKFSNGNDKFEVVNDRAKNKITIYKNGKNVSPKGIKQQLQYIENLLGIDYKVFSAFYYLSTATLHSVFDITNEQNLVYRFFDIETLNSIESYFKQLLKEYKREMSIALANIRSIEKQLTTLTSFEEIDKESLLNRKNVLLESLNSIENSTSAKKIRILKQQVEAVKREKTNKDKELAVLMSNINMLRKQLSEFNKGICPVCGQSVKDKTTSLVDELKELKRKKEELESVLEDINDKLVNMQKVLDKESKIINEKKNDIEREINSINTQLILYDKNKEQYKQLAENIEMLEQQKKEFACIYNDKKDYVVFIEAVLAIIKSKVLMKKYLSNFIKLFNKKIVDISNKLNVDIDIVVFETKGKLNFKFVSKGVEKTINALSSGEKTRASLIVLFAMLETLQILSNIQLNLLALDEILGVLDKEGVEILKQLLEMYKQDKSIFLIQHHKEIEDSFFDYVVKVAKKDGLTQVEFIGERKV